MIDANEVREALRVVLDPELGVNVVDLGLVYDVRVEGNHVHVDMTMTSAACPLHAYITEQIEAVIHENFPSVEVEVQLVWEPAWEPSMMSDEAKQQLGW